MLNPITWLLVADASKARIFSFVKAKFLQTDGLSGLTVVDESIHNESRLKNADLVSDRAGDFNHSSFNQDTAPKHLEAAHYAELLMKNLSHHYQQQAFRDCILIAPPAFMGLLKQHMPQQLQKAIIDCIEKDYTRMQDKQLAAMLMEYL